MDCFHRGGTIQQSNYVFSRKYFLVLAVWFACYPFGFFALYCVPVGLPCVLMYIEIKLLLSSILYLYIGQAGICFMNGKAQQSIMVDP